MFYFMLIGIKRLIVGKGARDTLRQLKLSQRIGEKEEEEEELRQKERKTSLNKIIRHCLVAA